MTAIISQNGNAYQEGLGDAGAPIQGRWPYLAQQIMRRYILPVARKLGITKRIGGHTFRHTYSTLLRSTGAELKIMQELLRHSTIRVTLDTYTQAVTTEKRNAQEAVVALLFPVSIPMKVIKIPD